ncbi:MAG TPA: chromosome condensation regulator RCC1 [Geomonas sp.]
MEIRKRSRLLICACFLAAALLPGCGSSSQTTAIPSTVSVFYQHGVFFRNHTTMTVGYNAFGQLGDGNGKLASRATAAVVPGLGHMDGCAAGAEHTLVFSNNSSVMAWGYNSHGQLGNSTVAIGATSSTSDFSDKPVRVGSLTHVTSVAAGNYHSLAVSGGRVWSWGYNVFGQLGVGNTNDASTPVEVLNGTVSFFSNATQVAAGTYHSLARMTDGTVWAWGDNTYGQLGANTGALKYSSSPLKVVFLGTDAKVVQIAAAGSYSLALMDDGTVWAWGHNGVGQLGFAANGLTPNPTPSQVKIVDPANPNGILKIDQISAGTGHVLARVGVTVWGWGYNERGQLGNNPSVGGDTSPNTFVPVQTLIGGSSAIGSGSPMTGVVEVQAFGNSSLAKWKKDPAAKQEEMWGWGENSFGQIGAPTVTTGIGYLLVPVPVAGF